MKHLKLVVDRKGTISAFCRNLEQKKLQKGFRQFRQKHRENRKGPFRQKEVISTERGHFGRKNPFRFCQFLQKESISAECPLFRLISVLWVLFVTFGFWQKLTLTNQLYLFRQKHFRSTTAVNGKTVRTFSPLFHYKCVSTLYR